MFHAPFTPFRNAFKRDLKDITDAELLELFYSNLRCINYFQDEDDLFVFLKIFEDVHMEVKRRGLRYRWTNKDIKKYRIMGQKMYYGSLSVNELEWRLGIIIMHAIPVYRNIVRSKLYLVRERIHIIIEAIHHQNHWSELEYNKDILETLDVPFFSQDNFSDIWKTFKTSFFVSENIIIFIYLVFYTVLRQIPIIWTYLDPDYTCLKLTLMIVFTVWFSCFVCDLVVHNRNELIIGN